MQIITRLERYQVRNQSSVSLPSTVEGGELIWPSIKPPQLSWWPKAHKRERRRQLALTSHNVSWLLATSYPLCLLASAHWPFLLVSVFLPRISQLLQLSAVWPHQSGLCTSFQCFALPSPVSNYPPRLYTSNGLAASCCSQRFNPDC